jgi:hypothetical protein
MKALYLEGIRFSMKKTALGVKGLILIRADGMVYDFQNFEQV